MHTNDRNSTPGSVAYAKHAEYERYRSISKATVHVDIEHRTYSIVYDNAGGLCNYTAHETGLLQHLGQAVDDLKSRGYVTAWRPNGGGHYFVKASR